LIFIGHNSIFKTLTLGILTSYLKLGKPLVFLKKIAASSYILLEKTKTPKRGLVKRWLD